MIPKYRVWISEADTMVNDLKGIDFENETVVLRKLYYEDGFPVETEVFEVEIGNAILMQSTGLRDMNNREIFEGDIITNGKDVMCMKRHNTLGFYVEQKGKVEFIADSAILEEFEEDAKEIADSLEIIGNIYENKELLEENE
jgi:hypothetical protein|nr:MAG TPA: YopX protein [Caudoviricetes sp.]